MPERSTWSQQTLRQLRVFLSRACCAQTQARVPLLKVTFLEPELSTVPSYQRLCSRSCWEGWETEGEGNPTKSRRGYNMPGHSRENQNKSRSWKRSIYQQEVTQVKCPSCKCTGKRVARARNLPSNASRPLLFVLCANVFHCRPLLFTLLSLAQLSKSNKKGGESKANYWSGLGNGKGCIKMIFETLAQLFLWIAQLRSQNNMGNEPDYTVH